MLTDMCPDSKFNLKRMSTVEISYDDIKHLRMTEGGKGTRVVDVMSGTEICHSSGMEMMRRFKVRVFQTHYPLLQGEA